MMTFKHMGRLSPDTVYTLTDCCKRTLCVFNEHQIDFNDSKVQDIISALYELGYSPEHVMSALKFAGYTYSEETI